MVIKLVNEIEQSLKYDNYLSALALALMIPDICGKAEYQSDKNKERYIKWYDEYLGQYEKSPDDPYDVDMPYPSGEIVYQLRCSFLHQGNYNINSDRIKEERCKIDKFILSLEPPYSGGLSKVSYDEDMTINEREIDINVINLCWKISRVAKNYYEANKEKFDFIDYEIIDRRDMFGDVAL